MIRILRRIVKRDFPKRCAATGLLVAVLGTFVPFSEAVRWRSVEFPDQFKAEEQVLPLRGWGIKKYFMFRVFLAAFYLGEAVRPEDSLSDVPKRLEIHYFLPVPGEQLAAETRRMIAESISPQAFGKIRKRLDVMDKYFVDLKPGDCYGLTYIPGKGTQFHYNGRLMGVIEGADFAFAVFTIWVGTRPLDRFLRAKLLGIQDLSAK